MKVQTKTLPLGKTSYLDYYLKVFKSKYHYVETEDILDCIQEGITVMYERGFDMSSRPLLYKVINSKIVDFIRKRQKTVETEKYYYDNHDKKYVETALSYMSPFYKNILTKIYIEGWQYKEIAELYNMNLNTMKSKIRRGKQLMLCLLQKI